MNRSDFISSNPMGTDQALARHVRQWVQRARAGDEEAFGELVKTYHQRVYSLACGMLNNPDDAHDATQQAWVKAWKNLARYRDSASFFTWLYRIVCNTCLDFLRQKARRDEQPLPENVDRVMAPDPAEAASRRPRPDEEAARADIRKAFEQALAELSTEHRMALILREVQGLSYQQIASVMKCRTGTVMSRLFYARRIMQKRLKGLL